tara:strand:+ start:1863 stop:2624 length:762 start_codon:yes stop_codon:yes gene_type:complete
MTIVGSIILLGKVIALLLIIILFSIINIKQAHLDKINKKKESFSILEGFGHKMMGNSEYFDGKCKIKLSIPFYFILELLGYLFYFLWWLWENLFRAPLAQLFKSILGEYYVYFAKLCGLIVKFYKLVFNLSIRVFFILFKIIWSILDIITRILFRILPTILKDIVAYIIAIPFLIFSPLIGFFLGLNNYFAVICWSETGLLQDIWYLLSMPLADAPTELDENETAEEDVDTVVENRKEDIDEAVNETKQDMDD